MGYPAQEQGHPPLVEAGKDRRARQQLDLVRRGRIRLQAESPNRNAHLSRLHRPWSPCTSSVRLRAPASLKAQRPHPTPTCEEQQPSEHQYVNNMKKVHDLRQGAPNTFGGTLRRTSQRPYLPRPRSQLSKHAIQLSTACKRERSSLDWWVCALRRAQLCEH